MQNLLSYWINMYVQCAGIDILIISSYQGE